MDDKQNLIPKEESYIRQLDDEQHEVYSEYRRLEEEYDGLSEKIKKSKINYNLLTGAHTIASFYAGAAPFYMYLKGYSFEEAASSFVIGAASALFLGIFRNEQISKIQKESFQKGTIDQQINYVKNNEIYKSLPEKNF